MIVKMMAGSDAVAIRLTIQGIADWAYLVTSPDHDYKSSGTSSAPIDLALGTPSDLNLEPVEWTLHLANGGSVDVDYNLSVEFHQAATTLSTWTKNGKIAAGGEVILEDTAVLIVGIVGQ